MFRKLRLVYAVLIAGSLLWMTAAYAQTFNELSKKLDAHLLVAESKSAHVDDMDRRLSILEAAARTDRIDARMARIETTVDSLEKLFFGLAVPVLLMGIDSLKRLMYENKEKKA